MKLAVFSLGVAALAFVVITFVFKSGMSNFEQSLVQRPESGKALVPPAPDSVVSREGPSRQSMKSWSADLLRREKALAAKVAAQEAGGERRSERPGAPQGEPGVVEATVFGEDLGISDTVIDLDEIDDVGGVISPSGEPGVAEVDPYPVAYVPGREAGPPLRAAPPGAADGLVPLITEFPEAMYEGNRIPIRMPNLEPMEKRQPPLMVPPGLVNLATERPVTSSDDLPVIGDLGYVTDGVKDTADGNYVELGPGRQWVQIDLGREAELYGVWLWHNHKNPRVYIDVVVQIANDELFSPGSFVTIYNADHDHSSGMGAGRDHAYFETNRGRVVDAQGIAARYVRLYSNGNTLNEMNHYIEVEVWGAP